MKKKIRRACIRVFFLLALSLYAPAYMKDVSVLRTVQAAKSTGKAQKTGLVKENGKIYYYTKKGKMVKRKWMEIDGAVYYFTKDGSAAADCGVRLGNAVYVFKKNGKLIKKKTPEIVQAGNYYYCVDAEGKAKTGFFKLGKKWYYGRKKLGYLLQEKWGTIDGSRYYFGKNCAAVTGGKKINGKVYVFGSDGKLIKKTEPEVVTVGKYSYYVDENGIAKTGWFMVGDKLCFADSNGRMKKDVTYEGVKFDSDGYAKSGTVVSVMTRASKICSSITNSSMSKAEKLRACWNYVCGGRFRYSTLYYPNRSNTNWVYLCAENMFNRRAGNCYGFACAFAVLARAAGYDNVAVVAGRVPGSRDGASDGYTRHAWVQIEGRYYDPEAQYAGWARGLYGSASYWISHQTIQTKYLY